MLTMYYYYYYNNTIISLGYCTFQVYEFWFGLVYCCIWVKLNIPIWNMNKCIQQLTLMLVDVVVVVMKKVMQKGWFKWQQTRSSDPNCSLM